MIFTPGLVSITCRSLSAAAVVEVAAAAGLRAIEWGGDVHCPHGDVARAQEVRDLTHARGLEVGAYGSYYRLGVSAAQGLSFSAVLASAQALGAPRIRVWAGNTSSADCPLAQRAAIIADARRCADLAGAVGLTVLSEWHGGTLTDTFESGRNFLRDVAHPHFATVWQPAVGLSVDEALAELAGVLPWVQHLHVFHWEQHDRRPLAEGRARWLRYVALAATAPNARGRLIAALEFVQRDDPVQLHHDAHTLISLLAPYA